MRIMINDCVFFVAEVTGIPRHLFVGASRVDTLREARRLTIWLARRHCQASWRQIAERVCLSNEHLAAVQNFQALERKLDRDDQLANRVDALEVRFMAWAADVIATRTLANSQFIAPPSPRSANRSNIEALQ